MSIKLRERKLKSGETAFYLDLYHNGKRSYEWLDVKINPQDGTSIRKEKREIVQTMRAQREVELLTQGTIITPKHKQKIDFLKYYANYLAEYKLKDVRMIRYSLERFVDFVNVSELRAEKVTPELCEGFKNYLKSADAGLHGETPRNYFGRFKKVVKAATKEGLFKQNPAEGVQFHASEEEGRYSLKKQILTPDELELLKVTPCGNNEVKRAFLFACYTGLGLAEIRSLKRANVNNDRLKVYRKKTKTEINNKLPKYAATILQETSADRETLFDLQISDTAINKALRNWVQRAGIDKNVSFYCGRHTFAILLLNTGANLKTVADCMGHTSTQHTVKYLNYTDSAKNAAIDQLDKL
jgi:integrase